MKQSQLAQAEKRLESITPEPQADDPPTNDQGIRERIDRLKALAEQTAKFETRSAK